MPRFRQLRAGGGVSARQTGLLLALLLLVLLASAVQAQALLRKDLKKDFGAVGDGRANDQVAFQKAAAFFNQRAATPAGAGRAELFIPAGTYRVGEPGPGDVPSLLTFSGCRNLRIAGADSATTVIRYADGLRYGTFDPTTHEPYDPPTAYATTNGVGVGTAISLLGCDNVEVADLSLDGNSPHLLVGGHWGDTGIQLGADGLFINNSRRVQLRRLAVHHFGRDGLQVLNGLAKSLDNPALEAIVLENSRFDYNGRQGLSITGVNGLQATNCSFSHTGRVIIPALNKPLFSNPGAGIDIEPEGGYATNVRLENCRLVDNAGQGLVSDRYGDGPANTARIVVRNCLFWGVSNWAVWLRQPGFLFENCRIYGAFEHGCRALQAGWETRFVGCTFEDRPYNGQPAYGPALLHSLGEARGMRFTNCRFVGTSAYLLAAVPAASDTASRFQLHGCTLVLNQAAPPLGAAEMLAGVVFSGTTQVLSGPARADTTRAEWVLGAAGVPAAVEVQPGARLQLLAPHCRYQLPSGLVLGPSAEVELGEGATLVLPAPPPAGSGAELSVGPGAQLRLRRGSTLALAPGTRLVVAGEVMVEAGATFQPSTPAQVQLVGRGRVRVAQP